MNWSKIKNIMIVLLVAINLFLLCDLAYINYGSARLSKEVRGSFVELLSKNGIEIDEKWVPRSYESRESIGVEFYSIDQLRDIFLKEKVVFISDGQNIIASTDDKRLVITGSRFEFTTLHPAVESSGNKIIKELDKLGLWVEGAFYDESDGLIKMKIDGALAEGVYIDAALSESGELAYARGLWPKIEPEGEPSRICVIEAVDDICEKLPEGTKIEKIEKVYTIDLSGHNKPAVPGWRVHFAGGYVTVN